MEGGLVDDGLWMVGGDGRKASTTRRGMMKRRVEDGEATHDQKGFE